MLGLTPVGISLNVVDCEGQSPNQYPVKMFPVPVHPTEAELISEAGSMQSCVQFGGGYRQISYKGLLRTWRVVFQHRLEHEMREIRAFVDSNTPFLWKQPSPHDSEGHHPTCVKKSRSSEVNGELVHLEYIFEVELLGHSFAQQASLKYGARDTGRVREPDAPPLRAG